MSKINLVNQRIALKNVEFKRFETSSVQPKLLLKDSIEDIVVNSQTISFTFCRTAHFEPDSFFSIKVEFIYIADVPEESIKAIEQDGKQLNVDYVKNTSEKIVNNTTIPSHASLIIANNTSLNGASPLVTPPTFIKQ